MLENVVLRCSSSRGLLPSPNCWWDGIKWYGPPACVENNDVNRQAVCQGWKHQISSHSHIHPSLQVCQSVCSTLCHCQQSICGPPCYFSSQWQHVASNPKGPATLACQTPSLYWPWENVQITEGSLLTLLCVPFINCHYNQTNTWCRMQSPSPVIAGPATKFTPNIGLLLSMANFHIFWQ